MSDHVPSVNIVTGYDFPLFTQHFDPVVDGCYVVENGPADRIWDLLIIFESIKAEATYLVRGHRNIFIAGEPPQIGNYTRAFLSQFSTVFCAAVPENIAASVVHEQHFNNWHFGYSPVDRTFRYDRSAISNLRQPTKTGNISAVTSNLNYLPMHIKRRSLISRLRAEYGDQVDIFGRPNRPVEYKEDAILSYRFHLCIENCSVPGLWTEKIADALLSYAIPVYAGCPDIERYFPGAVIPIDVDNMDSARRTIDRLLDKPDEIYEQHLPALLEARKRLIETFDISGLVRAQLLTYDMNAPVQSVHLRPLEAFAFFKVRDLATRMRRKIIAYIWRRKVVRRGR